MIDKSKAIKIIKQPRKSGGPRTVYIFNCKNCNKNKTSIRSDSLKISKQLCHMCASKKRPFESIYNRLSNDHRKTKVDLTYEEFLEFTKIENCYYCNNTIQWFPYATVEGKYYSAAHHLDRIDNNQGYHKNNIVVACSFCNRMRSNTFTMEEFKLVGKAFEIIYKNRIKCNK